MIRINQIKLPIDHTQGQLKNKIKKILKLRSDDFSYKILKKSIDARKKPELFYIYSVLVEIDNETHLVGRFPDFRCELLLIHAIPPSGLQ